MSIIQEPEVQEVITLVYSHFENWYKTFLWFTLDNPLLGGIKPTQMIEMGKVKMLLSFIKSSLGENEMYWNGHSNGDLD